MRYISVSHLCLPALSFQIILSMVARRGVLKAGVGFGLSSLLLVAFSRCLPLSRPLAGWVQKSGAQPYIFDAAREWVRSDMLVLKDEVVRNRVESFIIINFLIYSSRLYFAFARC